MENTEAEVTVEEIIHAVKKGRIVPFGKPVPWRLRLRKFL
jgi:hypothetical protein